MWWMVVRAVAVVVAVALAVSVARAVASRAVVGGSSFLTNY